MAREDGKFGSKQGSTGESGNVRAARERGERDAAAERDAADTERADPNQPTKMYRILDPGVTLDDGPHEMDDEVSLTEADVDRYRKGGIRLVEVMKKDDE